MYAWLRRQTIANEDDPDPEAWTPRRLNRLTILERADCDLDAARRRWGDEDDDGTHEQTEGAS
jgi:hypothetical protein